jgi:peptidoglycan-associated lipoprotein
MIRKLAVTTLTLLLILSFGCAKKTVMAPPETLGPGASGAPGGEAGDLTATGPAGMPGELGEDGLADGKSGASRTLTEAKFENDDVRFDYDRADISPEATALLDAKAKFLKSKGKTKVVIEGNCDERGSTEYNLALGERRAYAAKEYLQNLGIDPNRVDTVTYGALRPLDPDHTEEAYAKNRRDHFVIIER